MSTAILLCNANLGKKSFEDIHEFRLAFMFFISLYQYVIYLPILNKKTTKKRTQTKMKFFGQCVEAKAQLTFFISTEIAAAVFSCERST